MIIFSIFCQLKIKLIRFFMFEYEQKLYSNTNRSSHQGCSMKKGVVINFVKFTGKDLCQSLFNKVAGQTLLKRESGTGVFL